MLVLKAFWEGFWMSIIVDILIALGVVTIPLLMIGWPVTWGVCAWIRYEDLKKGG